MTENKTYSPKRIVIKLAFKLITITAFSTPVMVGCHSDSCRHHGDDLGLNSHQVEMCKDSSVTISKDLIPYFDSFISECKSRGIKYGHAYCLKWMKSDCIKGAQGVTDFYDHSIEINRHLSHDSVGMRFVVYHELGHWFGLDHGSGIMQRSYSTRHDRTWVMEGWDGLLNKHFDDIKRMQINNENL